jgi:hypothetical protein
MEGVGAGGGGAEVEVEVVAGAVDGVVVDMVG